MKQRTERLAKEIQAVLGEILARGDIKDPRVRDAGLITITRVRVTGDLREARVAFALFGAEDAALARVQAGLLSARAYLQQALGRRLQTRNTPTLSFEIDRVLDQALRVDALLREVAVDRAVEAAAAAAAERAAPGEEGPPGEGAAPTEDDAPGPPGPPPGPPGPAPDGDGSAPPAGEGAPGVPK
jgi:ribosome-binding factor A